MSLISGNTWRQIALGIGIGFFALVAFVLVDHRYQLADTSAFDALLCPSQYPTAEAAATGFQTFVTDYYVIHSDASLQDMLDARHEFYVSHHCTLELERYNEAMSGTAGPATMKMIGSAIQAALHNQ